MASYTIDSDVAADQAAARENSALLVRDGTKLTGNVQALTARVTTDQAYLNGDVITINVGCLPKGVRILPGGSSVVSDQSSAYSATLIEGTGSEMILETDQTMIQQPKILGPLTQVTTALCHITCDVTLGANLASGSTFEITVLYASPA
jgi:hypothetical protein